MDGHRTTFRPSGVNNNVINDEYYFLKLNRTWRTTTPWWMCAAMN